jgi:UDP-N-acetylglucosamine--N-acetylmuramyl-(pentapeptide) pyrophosphoryl-undecaprenol N-acetylglucosamine transferase
MRFPRILFYAVNGLGLGHVTRMLAIARKVRSLSPGAEIVFLTSSEAEDVIYREGFAAFKVPSKTLRGRTSIRPGTYSRMVQTVSLNLIAALHPHILVVDTFPAGAIQELLPVLRWDSKKVFVFRAQRPEAAASPLTQSALQLYDLAIIPHEEGTEEIPLPDGLDRVWTGPILIRDRAEALPRFEARRKLGLPAEGQVVYVTFGGGGDLEMETAVDTALEALGSMSSIHVAVASAPLQRERLARRQNVTAVDHYPMAEMVAAFDAAVSAAGYNTANELLHHGVPTVFIPFPRQLDDQESRAARIEAAGAGLLVDTLAVDMLRNAVCSALDIGRGKELTAHGQAMITENGADRAASSILSLLPG